MIKILFIFLTISANLFADKHSSISSPSKFLLEIVNCKGESTSCNDLMEDPIFEINFENNILSLSDEDKSELLSDPSFIKIAKEKTTLKGNKIDYLISFFHRDGFRLNFVFKGEILENNLNINKFDLKADNMSLVSADLKLR